MVTLFARRAKKDAAILCGACGQALGKRDDPWQYEPDDVQFHVFLPSGWTRRDDGVWVLGGHARRDMRRGKVLGPEGTPKAYRPTASAPPKDPWDIILSAEPASKRANQRPISRHRGWLLTELPVDIICYRSRCGMRQTLDADVLDVTAAPPELENDEQGFRAKSQIPGAIFMPDHDRSMKAMRGGRFRVLDKYMRESPLRASSPFRRKEPPAP